MHPICTPPPPQSTCSTDNMPVQSTYKVGVAFFPPEQKILDETLICTLTDVEQIGEGACGGGGWSGGDQGWVKQVQMDRLKNNKGIRKYCMCTLINY